MVFTSFSLFASLSVFCYKWTQSQIS